MALLKYSDARSEARKREWRDGRRKRGHSAESRLKISAALMNGYLSGRISFSPTTKHHRAMLSARRQGRAHALAKWWAFESPNGERIEGRNLNALVRENAALFDPADVVWTRKGCKGEQGLRNLTKPSRFNGSLPTAWKGWKFIEKVDGKIK